MGINLKKWLNDRAEEVKAQFNTNDGGATAATVRANRTQPAVTPVQQKIQTAKYGVLANNPQKQSQFINSVKPRRDYVGETLSGVLSPYKKAASYIKKPIQTNIVEKPDNTAQEMRKLQAEAKSGTISRNLAAARINALNTTSNARLNQFENSASFNPSATNKAGGGIINLTRNRKVAPVVSGMYRSAIGTGESAVGLYDTVTPGKGNSRLGQNIRRQGEIVDQSVKQNNYNRLAYKAGQAGTDVATFLLPGGAMAKGATTAGKFISKAPVIGSAVSKVNKAANAGNLAAKSARYLLSPTNLVNVASDTALSTGFRANRGQDINPTTLAIDAGLSMGMSGGIGLAGAGAKKVIKKTTQPATNKMKDRGWIRPSNLSDDEIYALQTSLQKRGGFIDDATYRLSQQAENKLGIDTGTPDGVMKAYDVIGQHRNFNTQQGVRKEAIQNVLSAIKDRTKLNQGGYIKNPLADLNDAQLIEKNYIQNLQFKQGEGAQLPKANPNRSNLLEQFKQRAKLNQKGFVRNPLVNEDGTPRIGKGAPIEKTVPVTKKVKTVYESDKVLNESKKNLNKIVKYEMSADNVGRDVIKEVKQYGGIGSSAYETLPKSVMNPDGRSADYVARELGFESEDALVEAINNQKSLAPKWQREQDAINRLKSGKSPMSEDYNNALNVIRQREDELSQLPITAKVINQKPSSMSEAEWNSIAETAPLNAKTTKQAVGQQLASVRAELESLKGTKAQLDERQRLNVISGNQQVAGKMREANAQMQAKVNELKLKERELAKKYAQESGADFNKPLKNMSSKESMEEIYTPKDLKNKQDKANFNATTNEYLGGLKSAELDGQLKARQFTEKHKLSDAQKIEVIRMADDPTYKSTDRAVVDAVKDIRSTYDQAYIDLTDKGVKMGYQASYYPRIYKHPVSGELISAPEYNLYTKSARQKGRTSDTINLDDLVTKDPAEAMKMYFSSIQKAASGRKYLDALENNGMVVKSTEPVRGLRPILGEGMQSPDGMFYYAKKPIADKLNNMFGINEPADPVSWLMAKGSGLNSAFQSFVLSGGVPNTPINAFGFMQLMKEGMALHPLKAGKAFYTGLNKNFASKMFTEKADTIKLMAENGLDTRIDLDAIAKKGFERVKEADTKGQLINRAWDEFTNDATFKRFMPALEVMHFENVYKGLIKKGINPKEAAKKAAEVTKNFYGKNDMAKEATRSQLTKDAVGATLFAPRFRESMLNFWGKNLKAIDPRGGFKNARSGEFNDNLKFMASAAAVYATMDGINYAVNGTHMYQNPDGKKDKLLLPNGDKYIGVPFLPSISTVPRNLGMGAYNLATGNLNEAGKNFKSFLSMPLRTAGDIITNENYFGAPIVEKDAGTGERLAQMGSYIAKSNMQPWIREGMNKTLQGAPDDVKKLLGVKEQGNLQTASQALELPFRFYDANNLKGVSPRFGANNPGLIESKSQQSKSDSAKDLSSAKLSAQKAFGLTGKKEADIKALADSGNQNAKDYLDNIKAMERGFNDEVKDLPSKLNKSAVEVLNATNRLTEDGRANWAKQTNKSEEIKKSLKGWNNGKDVPNITNGVAKEWAEYQKDLVEGKISKTKTNDKKKSIIRKAYESSLSPEEKDILTSGVSKAELTTFIEQGIITNENVDKALAVEKQLYDAGILTKEYLASKLGLDARGYKYRTSSGKSGKKGRSKSYSSKTYASHKDFNNKLRNMFIKAS